MSRHRFTPEQLLTLLGDAPPQIATLTAGLTPHQLRTRPGPEEWCAVELLAHLRACADVWGGAIATMLEQERPRLRALDPRTWVTRTDYLELEFAPSLEAYARQRAALVARLGGLAAEEWARAAVVTGAGRPLERTVLSYAQWMAGHERPHLKQMARLARRLRAAPPA